MVIAVAGGSGSGKTTFGRVLQSVLGDDRCAILAQDSYYRDLHELFDEDGGQINFDHPDSLEFALLAEHIRTLKAGGSVQVPVYDFASHSRQTGCTLFQPKPIILVDGILILTQDELRPLFDFSFFVDTAENLRFERRLHRDVRERGRTPEGVRQQFFRQVKPMHDRFVEPSRRYADRVISGAESFAPMIESILKKLADLPVGHFASKMSKSPYKKELRGVEAEL